ncbi:MAG: hypothetical protein ACLP1D_27840 [Xanthobacteraceae bacterium]|jgi:hypothetical protein
MDDSNPNLDDALRGVDEGKRATLKRLIGTGAFVGPIVVSFTMADLTIDAFMHAASANITTTHRATTSSPATTVSPPGTTAAPGTTKAPVATTTTASPTRGHPAKS